MEWWNIVLGLILLGAAICVAMLLFQVACMAVVGVLAGIMACIGWVVSLVKKPGR